MLCFLYDFSAKNFAFLVYFYHNLIHYKNISIPMDKWFHGYFKKYFTKSLES